jgi:hypothetical protein
MQYRAWVSGLHTNCELFWPGLSGWPRVQVEAVGLGQQCAEKSKPSSAEVPCLLFSAHCTEAPCLLFSALPCLLLSAQRSE